MRVWIGAVFLLAGLAGAVRAAPADAEAEAAARDVLASDEYQTSLPQPEAPLGLTGGRRSTTRRGGTDSRSEDSGDPPSFEPGRDTDLGAVAKALFYLVVIVAAAFLLLTLARWFLRPRQENLRMTAAPTEPEQGPAPPPPLTEHERLAGEERFDEAIHVLLLHALAPLRARFSDAHTSREIAARAGLPPDAGEALRGLVGAVERSHFGGIGAGRAGYDECVRRFRAVEAAHSDTRVAAA